MKNLNYYQYIGLMYLFLLLLNIGCQNNYSSISFERIESERTKLINGIESYQNIDEFKAFLRINMLQWEESQDSSTFFKGRPPYNIHSIKLKNYSHLSFFGELNIGFFNNRLMDAIFYPTDIEKYIESLAKEIGVRFDSNQEVMISLYTKVRLATDYKGRKYIEWLDIRLDKEMELWIKRYS